MDNYVAAFLGFSAFLLVWNRTVRWAYTIWVAIKERRSGQSRIQLPVLLFVHSGPWFLALYVFLAIHILSSAHRPEWDWFFRGALLVPPVISLLVLRAWKFPKKPGEPSRLLVFAAHRRATFLGLLWAFFYIPFLACEIFFMRGISDMWVVYGTPVFAAVMAAMAWYMQIWPQVSYYLFMKDRAEREQTAPRL